MTRPAPLRARSDSHLAAARPIAACLLLAVFGLTAAGMAAAAPAIRIAPASADFGTMNQQEQAERTAQISNAGDADLILSEVYSSCPCTFPAVDREVIPPGGSATLTITFYSKTLQGLEERIVEISTNDPARSRVEFPISAYVRAPIFVEPASRSLDFGLVPRGQIKRLTAVLQAQEAASLTVTPAMVNRDLFEVAVTPAAGERGKVTVTVALREDAPAGSFREILRLDTDAPGMPHLDLEATGTVQADLQADPEVVNFRFVEPGQELSQVVRVKTGLADLRFKVTGAEIDLPGMTAELKGDGSVLLKGRPVAADHPLAAKSAGRIKGTLILRTDLPAQPEIAVKVLYMLRM